ncbi:MAG: 2-iminoacetate synthase ThiH, partial [Syntrophaceae bacterium]|nr:2-iminoacetate synthase ThiH [Syntrophaceae bacterium]
MSAGTFFDVIRQYRWEETGRHINGCAAADVERALAARTLSFDDLAALLSPAAVPFLEEMAQQAHQLTLQRFGRVMGLFTPLYLSNVCTNACVYCGFNRSRKIRRLTLTPTEAGREAEAIHALGIRQ